MPQGQNGQGDHDDADEVEDHAGPEHVAYLYDAAAEYDGVRRGGHRQHEAEGGEEGGGSN